MAILHVVRGSGSDLSGCPEEGGSLEPWQSPASWRGLKSAWRGLLQCGRCAGEHRVCSVGSLSATSAPGKLFQSLASKKALKKKKN